MMLALDGKPKKVIIAAPRKKASWDIALQVLENKAISKDLLVALYIGPTHPHEAQSPAVLDFKSMNPKNALRG